MANRRRLTPQEQTAIFEAGVTNIYSPAGEVISKIVPNFEPSYYYGQFRMGAQSMMMDPNKPYSSHSWIYVCASTIAKNLCRLPAKLAQRANGDDEEQHIYKHPILNLFNRPNEWQSGSTFWEAVILGLLLPTSRSTGGQIFLVPEDNAGNPVDLTKGIIPARIYPLDDSVMSPDIVEGKLVCWKYQIPGTNLDTAKYFKPNELIRIYNYNPYDISKGLAPYVPVRAQALQDSEADNWNYFYFKNNARPDGILTGDLDLTPSQRQDISRVWAELYGGSHKAGSIAVLGNGLKFQELSRSHLDMQWKEQKDNNRDTIMAAYSLNELAAGSIKGIPYSNVIEGRKILWYDSYLPWNYKIWEAINTQWIQYIPPTGELHGESDLSEVQALKADLGERVKIGSQMIQQMTIPPAEAIRIVGIDIDTSKYDWMTDRVQPTAPGGFPAPTGEPSPKERKVNWKAASDISEEEKHAARNNAISEEYCKAVLDPGEKSLNRDLQKFFSRQRNKTLDKVDAWSKAHKSANQLEMVCKATPQPGPSVFLFDVAKENEEIMSLYKPHVKDQMVRETNRLNNELPNGCVNWSVNDDSIQAFAALRREAVEGINTTTFNTARDVIEDIVADGIDQGLTNAQLAEELKDGLYDVFQMRISNAMTIARTETGSISSMTRMEAFRAEDIEYWEWVSSRDDRVRDGHDIDGEVVRVGDQFSNGLTMPLDPDGEPENTINCRCVAVFAQAPEEEA